MKLKVPNNLNCLLWALFRRFKKGGYIRVSPSSHLKIVPHFSWSHNKKYWWSYSPIKPRDGIKILKHGCWFKGYLVLKKDE